MHHTPHPTEPARPLPDYRSYKWIFLVWLVLTPCSLVLPASFHTALGIFNDLILIYFIWGLKRYARQKGSTSSSFAWGIGITLASLPLYAVPTSAPVSEWDDGWLLISLLALPLLIALFVAWFGVWKAFRNIREKFLARSMGMYIVLHLAAIAFTEYFHLSDTDYLIFYPVDLVIYFLWSRFLAAQTETA